MEYHSYYRWGCACGGNKLFVINICSLDFLVPLILLTPTHIPCEELLCCCLWKKFCWRPCWCSGSAPPGPRFGSELADSGPSGPASASESAWSVDWRRPCCSPCCCCQAAAASCAEPRRWHWTLAEERKEMRRWGKKENREVSSISVSHKQHLVYFIWWKQDTRGVNPINISLREAGRRILFKNL